MGRGRALFPWWTAVTGRSRRLRKRHTTLCAAVLLVLLLRALIPVGFMPVASSGRVSLALCPGEAASPPSGAAEQRERYAGHAHGDHSRGHSGGSGSAHHAPCLFATGGAAALTPAAPAPALRVPAATRILELPQSGLFLPTILRAQVARGPPVTA